MLFAHITRLLKAKSCLTSVHDESGRAWRKLPRNVVFCIGHELDSELAMHIDLILVEAVGLSMLAHGEAERLTHDIVEGHCEEVAT